MSELVSAREAVASVSTGKQVNQDAWMTQWCSTNWGDLLQPAPLSISLLGSILIIASSTDDFSKRADYIGLDSKTPPGCPKFTWTYALHPNSFKTCLQQMVGNGYTAFETAHKNMEIISNNASQMPEDIATIVNLVLRGSAQDLADLFQDSIDDLQGLSTRCRDAAHETEQAFKGISDLAQEMVLACTYTAGTSEQALAQNKIQLDVLKVQKEHEEAAVTEAQETTDLTKASYKRAEEEFLTAVKDVPKGWDFMGMQVVESLTSLVVSAGNAAISQAAIKSQFTKAGIDAFSNLVNQGSGGSGQPVSPGAAPVAPTTSPNGVSSQPNSAALSDPGTMLVQQVLTQVSGIKMLLTGHEGKPDWEKIRGKDGSQSEAGFVQGTLNSQRKHLDLSKPISYQLDKFIAQALAIIGAIIETAGSVVSSSEDSLKDQVAPTDQLIAGLTGLTTSTNLILQQPGMNSTGPATPATPPQESSAAKLAVENAKFTVDQTKSHLEASRASYEKAADRLASQQMDITKTIGDMTKLSLTNASLQQMLPVLKKAVGAFTTLRAQFSQLVQFFESVASLLNDVMAPSVGRWVKTMESAEKRRRCNEQEDHVAGVTVSSFTQDFIYRQMMTPLKVSMLATSIATEYLSVSNDYILPAQRSVGHMLQFAASDSAEDKAELIKNLEKAQANLSQTTARASTQISTNVSKHQKSFQSSIDARLEVIVKSVQVAIPAVAGPVPGELKAIMAAHVADTDATKALQAKANPMFNTDDTL
ncbi:hypothetical protein GGX14DRAFT_362543 [Mycena pura]|uniref:Uncharacterized protein n=1 Tax=Mycena pura TaxID=153505 RepID=A0AAD6VFZ4_9AGAR|nr:hypothetical protein GGX14DRAFT_362543 [Mycena pura]